MRIKTFIRKPDSPATGNAILFTGRGGTAEEFVGKYAKHLKNTRLIGLEPASQWYPIPNGAGDQEDAVNGLRENIVEIKRKVDGIVERFGIAMDDLVFVGYSAGAVVCLKLIVEYGMDLALAVLHSGALFETDSLPDCVVKTPIMLIHSQSDDCFSWNERYVPMKRALVTRKYKLLFREKADDGHSLTSDDLHFSSCEIASRLSGKSGA